MNEIKYKQYNKVDTLSNIISSNNLFLKLGETIVNKLPPETIFSIQKKNAYKWFKFATKSSKAYRDFLSQNNINVEKVKNFEDLINYVPFTTKKIRKKIFS